MTAQARRRWTYVAITVAMIAAVTVTATRSEAAPVFVDVGTLDLILDESGTDQLLFNALPGSGKSDLTDNIGTQGACNLKENGPDDPATFTSGPSGSVVGKKKTGHEIGVRFNEGNGEPCARIDNELEQTLTLALGPDLSGLFMDSGNVALKMKFGAQAKVTARNGMNVVGSLTLACGGSDCGPDSGGDRLNFPLTAANGFTSPFDSIEISIVGPPSDGAASLIDDPGFDTYFNIVEEFDGTLECEQTAEETSGGATGAFTRLTPEGAAESCDVQKFYRLVVDPAQIEFIPNAGVPGLFKGELTFPGTPANPLTTTLEYDKDGPGPGGFVNTQWCEVRAAVGGEVGTFGELNGGNSFPELPSSNDSDGNPPTSCIVAFSTDADGPEEWVVFLTDDPYFK